MADSFRNESASRSMAHIYPPRRWLLRVAPHRVNEKMCEAKVLVHLRFFLSGLQILQHLVEPFSELRTDVLNRRRYAARSVGRGSN